MARENLRTRAAIAREGVKCECSNSLFTERKRRTVKCSAPQKNSDCGTATLKAIDMIADWQRSDRAKRNAGN